jgi:hypothetical protein
VKEDRFRKSFLLLVVAGISILFLAMIRGFLMTLLVAAIVAGILHPIYRWILRRVGGRATLASLRPGAGHCSHSADDDAGPASSSGRPFS